MVATIIATTPVRVAANRADLSAFLERAHRMAGFPGPVRADIRIEKDGEQVDRAVLIVDPAAGKEFFAMQSAGWRALLPLSWGTGKAAISKDAKATAMGVDDPLPKTALRPFEFFPFWQTDYSTAFISDSNRMEKTITLYAPPKTPYTLFVITFDKEKIVPLAIKYYKDNMNTLVRLRRDTDHIMVGSRPRPQSIEIRDFTDNSTTVLSLVWRTLDNVPPGVTDDAAFATASVTWPAEPVAAR